MIVQVGELGGAKLFDASGNCGMLSRIPSHWALLLASG